MATKTKTFLHPIIRSNSQDYIDGSYFNAEITAEISSEVKDSIRIRYSVNLSNDYIEKLVDDNLADIYLNLYCADTIYRNLYLVDKRIGEFILPVGEVIGSLEIEPIILSKSEMHHFLPPESIKNLVLVRFR